MVLAPEAAEDLIALHDQVALRASADVAMKYLDRVEAFCRGLGVGSERGRLRDEVRPGLRITSFERRLTLAFTVADDTVTILRVFRAGRNWEEAF